MKYAFLRIKPDVDLSCYDARVVLDRPVFPNRAPPERDLEAPAPDSRAGRHARTSRTGNLVWCTTASDTLPRNSRLPVERPRAPMTSRSYGRSSK
jgi:hypothetical protein